MKITSKQLRALQSLKPICGLVTLMITPVSKPRMTQRDKWLKRPATTKYWDYCQELRTLLGDRTIPDSGYHLTFYMPMPASWSKAKKEKMEGQPHQQKPDKDNLEKAFLDALFDDDSKVWDGRVTKRWSSAPRIEVEVITPKSKQ
jgi:Holliday junction resolvase RusA-like endonuclease